jgi:hypothetical protein
MNYVFTAIKNQQIRRYTIITLFPREEKRITVTDFFSLFDLLAEKKHQLKN